MKKIQKKEIRNAIEIAMNQALSTLEISDPSKKTRKVIDKVSKKITNEVKRELKKQTKRATKANRPARKNGVSVSKTKLKAHKIEAAE
jgi:hypothetical protein